MLNERALRRPGFRPGTPVRLADGQEWVFPGPRELLAPGLREGGAEPEPERDVERTYPALIAALDEAEDEPDRLRAELALGIFLLGFNYALGPDDYQHLLHSPPGDPHGASLRQSFRRLADDHARHNRPAYPQHQPTASFRFWPLHRLLAFFRRRVV